MKYEGMSYALTIEELVKRIHTINHFWKSHQDDNKSSDSHGEFFRHTKLAYQIELLRREFPSVYLQLDTEETSEEIYSVVLPNKIGPYTDGAHMPKRLAEEFLTKNELAVLVRNYK
ncbi:hypothetical protein, partial [Oleiphilus sp. HI0086]